MTYEAPAVWRPGSVVAKIEANDEAFRQAAAEISAFEREVGFCRDVSGRVPIRWAHVRYANDADDP